MYVTYIRIHILCHCSSVQHLQTDPKKEVGPKNIFLNRFNKKSPNIASPYCLGSKAPERSRHEKFCLVFTFTMQELQDQNENKQESSQLYGLLMKVVIWAMWLYFMHHLYIFTSKLCDKTRNNFKSPDWNL